MYPQYVFIFLICTDLQYVFISLICTDLQVQQPASPPPAQPPKSLRIVLVTYSCRKHTPKVSDLKQWYLLSHNFHSQESRNGLAGASGSVSLTDCSQGVSWGCGLIWRFNWKSIYFQAHAWKNSFLGAAGLRASITCWQFSGGHPQFSAT